MRAQDIVVELLGSLNHEAGGQIADQLASVYDYCFRQLVTANVKKDPAPAREVIGILRDLGTAWQEIAAQQRQAQRPPGRRRRAGRLGPSDGRLPRQTADRRPAGPAA